MGSTSRAVGTAPDTTAWPPPAWEAPLSSGFCRALGKDTRNYSPYGRARGEETQGAASDGIPQRRQESWQWQINRANPSWTSFRNPGVSFASPWNSGGLERRKDA